MFLRGGSVEIRLYHEDVCGSISQSNLFGLVWCFSLFSPPRNLCLNEQICFHQKLTPSLRGLVGDVLQGPKLKSK